MVAAHSCRRDSRLATLVIAPARHLMLQTFISILIQKERLRIPWTPSVLKA
jgi:hypothetical protein